MGFGLEFFGRWDIIALQLYYDIVSSIINPILTLRPHYAALPLLSVAARRRLSRPSLGVSRPVAKVIISRSSVTPNNSAILSNPNPFVSGIHLANTIAASNVNPPYMKYGPLALLLKKYGAVNATTKLIVQLTHC